MSSHFFGDETIKAVFRRSCFPGVVRHFVQVHAQECFLLYRPPCEIHPLEVCRVFVYHTRDSDLTREACQRQTVFYTPTTITISQGQTIRGRLTCAPNTKNNRDLDITIAYETDGKEMTVEYKMCVAFPFFDPTSPCLVNFADRWSGANCIFMIIVLLCYIGLSKSSRVARACLLFDGVWRFGAVAIQVLI